jgi:glyoxylase-like metal-dependent hydrolase (beta-lactamase superfamily II)
VKSRKLRIAVVLLVLAVPAYWWLLVESAAPAGVFPLEIGELRRLANELPGDKPEAVLVEEVLDFEFPQVGVLAGSGWSFTKLPVFSYQLLWDDRTVVVDTAMDAATATAASRFDDEAYERMISAMRQASLIVVTHEHSDHLGGLATHPQLSQLAAKLTDAQLADPSKRRPLVFPEGVLAKRTPFTYERAVAIAPGVVLWKAPGHTPGSQLVYVQRQDGEEFLLLGDVAWHEENYQQVTERARLVTLFLGEDREAVLRQLAAIKALVAAEPKLHVVPGHDGAAMKRLLDAGLLTPHFAP